MAAEIIKIASSLIPQYDGNGEKLSNILAALHALKSVATAETEPVAIQIILSKLEKKARTAVGTTPRTIDEIIENLKIKCKQTISADTILAKLNNTRQTGEINKFSDDIEQLTNQLETAYINDDIPAEVAARMSLKSGVRALGNGLKNPATQTIIKSGTFTSLAEAIEKATENDTENTQQTNMLYYRQQRQGIQYERRNWTPPHTAYNNNFFRQGQNWRNNQARRTTYGPSQTNNYNNESYSSNFNARRQG